MGRVNQNQIEHVVKKVKVLKDRYNCLEVLRDEGKTSKSPRKEELKRHRCSINYDVHRKSEGVKEASLFTF